MLSSRGAITTNVAMVECAGGQNARGKEVFLLSELEKVWVAVCIIARRHLLERHNVQIPNFGSFWLEQRCLINDTMRYRQRFYIHQLKFGVNQNFSLRYGMDSMKAPLEKQNLSYTKVHMADVVNICGVPAHTAAMALKEFIMYLGEGLYSGRTFQLSFPGVATLIIKKERFMLTMDAELQGDLFDMDSRKWPSEMQAAGRAKLEEESIPRSAVSTRPTSRASRATRPSTAASSNGGPKPVFNPAAPKDRLFAEIEKETARRREAEKLREQAEFEAARRQEHLDHLIGHYDCYTVEDEDDAVGGPGGPMRAVTTEGARTVTYRPATGESVYAWAEEAVDKGQSERRPHPSQRLGDVSSTSAEPDVEVIEVTEEKVDETRDATKPPAAPASRGKDPLLEAILRQEEVFSRPASRRRDCIEHTSVRDLIYGATPSTEPQAAPNRRPPTAPRARRVDPVGDDLPVPPQHARFSNAAAAAAENTSGPQFGRKRHAEYYSTNDTVGDLLKCPDAAL